MTSHGVRPAAPADLPLLEAMLAEAICWRDGVRAPVADVIAPDVFSRYVDGWPRVGDHGVVVPDAGASWWRHFDAERPGYGHIADDIPEVTIGVVPRRRGQGLGGALLRALQSDAIVAGLPGLSLSVEEGNPAVRLYRRAGFVVHQREGNALTMWWSRPPDR